MFIENAPVTSSIRVWTLKLLWCERFTLFSSVEFSMPFEIATTRNETFSFSCCI